jgi:hypothetical protein
MRALERRPLPTPVVDQREGAAVHVKNGSCENLNCDQKVQGRVILHRADMARAKHVARERADFGAD